MSAYGAVRVLVPAGMLGGGFPAASVARARELGADVIAVDGGSTDSGPHYLGAAVAKTARAAVARDLRLILLAARDAQIPVVVGSCGTSGTDAGVDWVYDIAAEIARSQRLPLTVARIYSEQTASRLVPLLRAGRIKPLPPAGALTVGTLRRCSHIVAVLGYEPIAEALGGARTWCSRGGRRTPPSSRPSHSPAGCRPDRPGMARRSASAAACVPPTRAGRRPGHLRRRRVHRRAARSPRLPARSPGDEEVAYLGPVAGHGFHGTCRVAGDGGSVTTPNSATSPTGGEPGCIDAVSVSVASSPVRRAAGRTGELPAWHAPAHPGTLKGPRS
jgi:hypothetical protein